MSAWVQGVVERTFRCSSIAPLAPGVVQAQVRVVIRQHAMASPRVHALLSCGFGDAGEQAATLLRKRLRAGRTCTAQGKWLEPLQGCMDLLLAGCHQIHTDEDAATHAEAESLIGAGASGSTRGMQHPPHQQETA
jgi:hypothetical protein